MSRPELTPANSRVVYDYYAKSRANEHWQRMVSAVLHNFYQPEVEIDAEARDRLRRNDRTPLIVSNHPSAHDPTMVASEMVHCGAMPPVILTKSQLLARPEIPHVDRLVTQSTLSLGALGRFAYGLLRPDSIAQWPPRLAFEAYGCVPVFRPDSYPDASPRQLAEASRRLIDLSAGYLSRGTPVLVFPEGGLSSSESRHRLSRTDVKGGIGHIALAAADRSYIQPVGVAHHPYGSGEAPKHSRLAIGAPLDIEPGTPLREVQTDIYASMQQALDSAYQGL